MVFSSFVYLFAFLPTVLACYFLIPRRRRGARNWALLLFSLLFYFYGEPKGIFVMLFVILLSYFSALAIDRTRGSARRAILTLSIAAMIAVIGYYKYAGFALENLGRLLGKTFSIRRAVMPIGISFFTFQSMSYVIDVYRRTVPVQRNPAHVALYVTLFPQLVAGPIVRYETVAEELVSRRETAEDFYEGFCRFLIGLGKKMLLANPLGEAATALFTLPVAELSAPAAWAGAIFFALQIYFDFSGYSDMAIGLGRIFGFHFLENFRDPYCCCSITDFWRRWHISLSTWFRDYVYIPLGGNRCGRARQILNILIVWALTGLWHGASWNFVLWGLYFAVLLLLEKFVLGRVLEHLPAVIRHALALLGVLIGWVIFNCTTLRGIGTYLHAMFLGGLRPDSGTELVYLLRQYGLEAMAGIFLSTGVMRRLTPRLRKLRLYEPLRAAGLLALFALSLMALVSTSFNPFIYFRF